MNAVVPASPIVRDLMRARAAREPLAIPPEAAALSPQGAYALQREHERDVLNAYGGRRIGTKLGGGNLKELAALGLSGPFRGPIISSFTHTSPARLRRTDFFVCAVEAEIAVVLARDLGGDGKVPSRGEIAEAIGSVLPAVEVADTRWSNFKEATAGAILADLGFAGAWIGGEPVKRWREIDLAALPVLLLRGGHVIGQGVGMRAMGDPLLGIQAALADLAREGGKLAAGDIVSTGTCTVPYMAAAGDSLVADFGPLGQVRVDIA